MPWLCIFFTVGTFIWIVNGLGRGFELTDESFYVLSAVHADSIRLFFTPAHWVSAVLWKVSGTLLSFRALGLALVITSSTSLAWAVMRLAPLASMELPASRSARGAVLAAAASGGLLYGSLLNFTPSYNLLGASGACLAMAFGLMSIPPGSGARAFEILAGVMLGITVLCKFSAGVCTAGLLLGLHAVFLWRRQPSLRRSPLLIVASCAATVLFAVLLETGIDEARRQFRAGVEIMWFAQGDKSTWARITRSASDVATLLTGTAVAFAGPLACFAASLRWRPTLFGCLGVAWFAGLLALDPSFVSGGASFYEVQGLPLVATLGFALMGASQKWASHPRSAALVLTLIVFPFAIAIGTSNPLQIQFLTAMAPWGLVIALFGFSNARAAFPVAISAVLFTAIVLLQVITNGAEPYRMRPLPQQTETVVLEHLGTVKVDSQTAAMVRDMQRAARVCGVPPGVSFLDFYGVPGVALMIGGVPVESPWLLDQGYATLALKQADSAVLSRAVIAVKLDQIGQRPTPPRQLAKFPQGFKFCGSSVGPFDGLRVELWAPNDA